MEENDSKMSVVGQVVSEIRFWKVRHLVVHLVVTFGARGSKTGGGGEKVVRSFSIWGKFLRILRPRWVFYDGYFRRYRKKGVAKGTMEEKGRVYMHVPFDQVCPAHPHHSPNTFLRLLRVIYSQSVRNLFTIARSRFRPHFSDVTYVIFGIFVALHQGYDDIVYEVAHGQNSSQGGKVHLKSILSLPIWDVYPPNCPLDRHENQKVQHAEGTWKWATLEGTFRSVLPTYLGCWISWRTWRSWSSKGGTWGGPGKSGRSCWGPRLAGRLFGSHWMLSCWIKASGCAGSFLVPSGRLLSCLGTPIRSDPRNNLEKRLKVTACPATWG